MKAGKFSGPILLLLLWGCLGIISSAHAQVPSIVVPPASQSSAVGGTIQFTVSATGGGTLAYQWRKNGTHLVNGVVSGAATISGATTTAVTLTTVTTNDQANYTCRITNSSGSITSSIASLTVVVSPTIITQPKSANTNVGSTVAFIVVASGTAPFTYQWYKDSSPISGATLNAYSISGVFISDSGTYNVRISNAAGTSTSSNAVLNVGIVPAITSQPSSLIVTQGQSASFSVTATGTPLNYYWKKNGTFISGQTNSSLAFASTVPTNAAAYTCQVSNFLGNVISAGAGLTVYYPPTITIQPVGKTVGVGSNFTVSVTASGVPTVAYQWRTNGAAITGATASSYTVTAAQTNHAGSYDVVITNSLGSLTSSVANISIVYYPPTISQQPIGGNIAVGNSFILFASATGTAPISWQWFKDGLAISNAVTVTTNLTGPATFAYTNNSAQIVDSGNYQVVLENSSGSATSTMAVVNVGYAPVVVQQPISATNILGGSNTFSCVITGTAPINLQWTRNGNPLPGETNTTLTIKNLQTANIGYYALTATNAFGGTGSSNVTLNLTGYDFGIWNGLIAYYPFNGNAEDESGNGNNLTNSNTTLQPDRFGTPAKSRWLDGSAYLASSNVFPVVGNSPRTISAWCYVTNLADKCLAQWGTQNYGTDMRLYMLNTGSLFFNGFYADVTSTSAASIGSWFHVVYTYSNSLSDVCIYLNGMRVSSSITSQNVASLDTTPNTPLVIGGDESVANFWRGGLDDVRIYNRALSSNEVATLFALEADLPVITQQSQAQTANVGGTVTFTVTATANYPLFYQWFKDGFALNSATNTSLTLSNVQPNQIGYYSVAVSNGVAGVTSTNAALNLNGYNFSQWLGLVAYYPFNGNANDASGSGFNGVVSGAVSSQDRFGISNTAYAFSTGNSIAANIPIIPTGGAPRTLSLWCKLATNAAGTFIPAAWGTASDNKACGIMAQGNTTPSWYFQFYGGGQDLNSGIAADIGWHHLLVTYQANTGVIYLDGFPEASISKFTSTQFSPLTIGVGVEGTTYFPGLIDDVRIYNRALSSNEVTSLYSIEADVPVITQQPQAQTVNAGSTVTFSVAATANHPLTYQWQKNCSPISGATNSILTISNVQSADIAFYSAAVSNTVAGVVSATVQFNLTSFADPTWVGLIAYYPFSGNANDASGNGFNGTNNGASLTTDRFAVSSAAYSFNGTSSYIDCGTNISLGAPAGQFAISAWFKTTAAGTIIADYDAPSGGDGIFAVVLGIHGTSQVETDTRSLANDYDAFSTRIPPGNQWHQAIYIMDGSSNLLVYIDGQLDHKTAYLAASDYISNPHWRIGANKFAGAINDYFSGSIDDIRIYNRALSADEVAYLYQLETQTTSIPPLNLGGSLGAGPSLNLIVTGLPSRNYVLQSATNLLPPIQWLPVLTNATDTNGVWQFADTNLTIAQKFFRVTTH